MKISKHLLGLLALITLIPILIESKRNSLSKAIRNKYGCCLFPQFICTDNVFCQLYANQNMCTLLQDIPFELQNLPYAIYPNCMNYDIFRSIYNKRFNIFPHAIIKHCNQSQLIHVLSTLRRLKLDFSLRSGGHCFESGSLSSEYIIDLGNFNEIKLNIKNQEVFIGAGARLGCVIQTLGNFGFAIPTGTCGTNGVGGLTSEGGLGFLSRKFGLTCDAVKNIKLVTADLNVIKADQNNYSDLFWALRGAGAGSYGIILGFTFNMFYLPKVSFLELSWDWDPVTVSSVITAFQSWITSLSDDITAQIDLNYLNGARTITVTAFKANNQPFTEWESAFISLNPKVTLKTIPYVDAAKIIGGDSPLPFLKSKSKMLFSPLPNAAINIIINFFENLFNNNKQFSVSVQIGSAGGNLSNGDTAYFPRQAIEWFFQHIRWNDQTQEADAISTINTFYSIIEPFCSPFSYANIVDYDLGNTYLNAYYGDHVARLIEIKNIYDPMNLFHWQQSIPL